MPPLNSYIPQISSLSSDLAEQARPRVAQIFRYLQALDQLRNPILRQVSEQRWHLSLSSLPEHESIALSSPQILSADDSLEAEDSDFISSQGTNAEIEGKTIVGLRDGLIDTILRVRRPELTNAPRLPPALEGWVQGWEDPYGSPHQSASRSSSSGATPPVGSLLENFASNPSRGQAWATWLEEWNEWSQSERPARQAMQLYEKFYEWHSTLSREGERYELMLGDGVLNWRRPEGGINHPLLLRRLDLQFDLDKNEFLLQETDSPVEFYSALFRGLTDVPGPTIRALRDEAKMPGVEPLGGEATDLYLKRLASRLSVRGEFCGTQRLKGEADHPRLVRESFIFVRNRTLGFSSALESVLAHIEEGGEISEALWGVVGVEAPPRVIDDSKLAGGSLLDANEDESVLLSKAANVEQLAIARRLEEHGNVLVQGPPGTGKTHTISNLIGHLLAQGKTVLVTSHTTKALRVLRDQVVEPLRPLCVSVLDNDVEGRHQLEAAVNAIVERLASDSALELVQQGQALAKQRSQFIRDLQDARAALLEARGGEYREIVVQGDTLSPSEAARIVAQGCGVNDWLPGPVTPGIPCPLSLLDLNSLYATNSAISPTDEEEMFLPLPETGQLPSAEAFAAMVESEKQFQGQELSHGEGHWRPIDQTGAPSGINAALASLQSLQSQIQKAIKPLAEMQDWKLAAVAAGQAGGSEREIWNSLLSSIEAVRAKSVAARESILTHGPELAGAIDMETQESVLADICAHLQGGGNLGAVTLLLHRNWKPVMEATRVGGSKPTKKEHFEALLAMAQLARERKQLSARWDRQMAPLGAPAARELSSEIEVGAGQFVPLIQGCLDWYSTAWGPIEEEMKKLGLDWARVLEQSAPVMASHAELLRLREAVTNVLPALVTSQVARLRHAQVQRAMVEVSKRLDAFG
ncbi:hypothetical protein EON80_13290, partial [bacterium]